ncbi:MAG: glycosyltransferase family 39 protein [Candidatus Bathyarchaeota archaeon]|nr:glycosyltransferase family 39 protein [Candidatus Bathyarchaeota archaeon]
MRWGFYLSEFDPHWQYRLGKHMIDNGFFAWTSWVDHISWYPWGRNVGADAFPGLSGTAAFFYSILASLGIQFPSSVSPVHPLASDPFFNFCVIFPTIMATLTCLVIYFLGKDIGGKEVGLLSALFLALNGSYISRTSLGFFDDEAVGIFGILLFIFFFLRSIDSERTLRSGFAYAVAAGLSLGYILISWGAARYPIGMAVLFVFILLLLRRYSSRLLLSYSVTFGISLFIGINIQVIGFRFLTEATTLAVFGIFLLLCAYEISSSIKTTKMKAVFVVGFLALLAGGVFVLSWSGYIRPLQTKFLSVILPSERMGTGTLQQLVQSVQEHRPAAWGTFYYDYGVGILFIPIGLYFAVRNPTNRNIFLCVFGLTSVYFASSMVRLTLLLGPAFCLLWALALTRMVRPFITTMKEAPIIIKRKMRFETHVGKEFSGAFLIFILLLLSFTLVFPSSGSMFPRAFDHAYSPVTIAAASMPIKADQTVTDWIDTLNWLHANDSVKVVASWWDYGYWITIIANKTTLADNGTFNSTQISQIGLMFMSNETAAIEILKGFEGPQGPVTHVVVFSTFDTQGRDIGWGEESKWRWMARIAGENDTYYRHIVENPETKQDEDQGWNTNGSRTVICKMLSTGKKARAGFITYNAETSAPIAELEHFRLVYYSKGPSVGGAHALVSVYEVIYD